MSGLCLDPLMFEWLVVIRFLWLTFKLNEKDVLIKAHLHIN